MRLFGIILLFSLLLTHFSVDARQNKGAGLELVQTNFEYIIQTLATSDLTAGRCQHAIGQGENSETLSKLTLDTLIGIRDSDLNQNTKTTLFNGTLQRARDPQFQQTFQASFCESSHILDLIERVQEIDEAVDRAVG
ncbi:hypothetical protein [Aliidiomarina celeris]|uniref:hypothetical protein n=1 Tax=Aliidiomarina celeris TaxID=2249428 RepID=UPI000DE85573|nr:hypothetical protein [Aliidiomarina celeris]